MLNRGIHVAPVTATFDQLIIEALMISLNLAMLRVLLAGAAQMPLAQGDDLSQTLRFDGVNGSSRLSI
jgi:hypothetical protein